MFTSSSGGGLACWLSPKQLRPNARGPRDVMCRRLDRWLTERCSRNSRPARQTLRLVSSCRRSHTTRDRDVELSQVSHTQLAAGLLAALLVRLPCVKANMGFAASFGRYLSELR